MKCEMRDEKKMRDMKCEMRYIKNDRESAEKRKTYSYVILHALCGEKNGRRKTEDRSQMVKINKPLCGLICLMW